MAHLKSWQFWLLNTLAVITLILVAVNISLSMGNRTVQTQVLQRQQFINQSIRLSRLNNQLIRALAVASAQTDDQQIRDLLSAHGVTFSVNADANTNATQ